MKQAEPKEDVKAELDRHLAEHDPAPRMAKFQARFQEAIRQKKVLEYMPEGAVEMSWGPPERIRDRLQAWRESGVTTVVCGTRQIEALRVLAEAAA